MANQTLQIPRKLIGTSGLQIIKSSDNGSTWQTLSSSLNTVTNTFTVDVLATDILTFSYTAQASMTEDADNAVVYDGREGVGDVLTAGFYQVERGCLLQESLIGSINTSSEIDNTHGGGYNLTRINLNNPNSSFDTAPWGYPRHTAIDLAAPMNNSPAVKALSYITEENGQLFLQYAYTELQHDGTDWGDDSRIHIQDGQTTMTDLNGTTVLVGTARTRIPLGWVHNKV